MSNRNTDMVQKIKIKTDPGRVFSALTDEQELIKWWPTQAEIDLREGGGFRMSFEPYSESTEKGQFLRIIRNQLLKFSSESTENPQVAREVTIEFKPSGEHTQVVITEAGWKRGKLWEKSHRGGEDNWRGTLQDLKIYLETGNDPRSGKKIVTESDPTSARPERVSFGRPVIRQRFLYKVKPKKVFQALTVPERLAKWFLKEAEVEFRRNGKVKMVWNDGSTQECKVLELVVNQKVTYSWPTNGWRGTPTANTTVKITLTPTPEEYTLLELEHTGFGQGEAWLRYYGATYSGWTYYLLNLKSVLENGLDLRDGVSETVITEPEEKSSESEPEPEPGNRIEV